MTQAQFFVAVSENSQVPKAQVRAVFAAVEEVVKKSLKIGRASCRERV